MLQNLKNSLFPELSQFFNWKQLPDEIKIIILNKLDIPDLNNMSLVSNETYNFIKDQKFWHEIAKQCGIDIPQEKCSKERILKKVKKIHSRASAWDIKLGEKYCHIPIEQFKEESPIPGSSVWQIDLDRYPINENESQPYIHQLYNLLFSKIKSLTS